MISKIERLKLRDIWKHEAVDFTKWLQENGDVLSDIIGINLVNIEREQSTGNFNVDLLAEDTSGNTVIIENQLEKSDHDHLGKIITYLTSFEAKIAIWIVAEPRQEHINAIIWLNESTNCAFYLLKIEAIKIGNSDPAPLLTLIAGPSDIMKEAGSTKKEISERHRLRYKFWDQLLVIAKNKHSLFGAISPTEHNWIGAGSGKRGVQYTYWITKDSVRIELYIDRGIDSDEENLDIFNQLKEKRSQIENSFGSQLEWSELPDNRACIIRKIYEIGGWKDPEENWNKVIDTVTDGMVKFEKAFKPVINELKI